VTGAAGVPGTSDDATAADAVRRSRRRALGDVLAAARVAERVLLVLVMLSLPLGLALTAIGHAPDAHVRIAGQDVSVRPVLGQSSSRLFGGALVEPRHATVPALG
jgi:hypothetical protein